MASRWSHDRPGDTISYDPFDSRSSGGGMDPRSRGCPDRGGKRSLEEALQLDNDTYNDRHGNPASASLFIDGLPQEIASDAIENLFRNYKYTAVKLGNRTLRPGECRTCTIEFPTVDLAISARTDLQHFQGARVQGWTGPMVINFARQKRDFRGAHGQLDASVGGGYNGVGNVGGSLNFMGIGTPGGSLSSQRDNGRGHRSDPYASAHALAPPPISAPSAMPTLHGGPPLNYSTMYIPGPDGAPMPAIAVPVPVPVPESAYYGGQMPVSSSPGFSQGAWADSFSRRDDAWSGYTTYNQPEYAPPQPPLAPSSDHRYRKGGGGGGSMSSHNNLGNEHEADERGNRACSTLFIANFSPSITESDVKLLFPDVRVVSLSRKVLEPGQKRSGFLKFGSVGAACAERRRMQGHKGGPQEIPLRINFSSQTKDIEWDMSHPRPR